jgi:hypothetical protein
MKKIFELNGYKEREKNGIGDFPDGQKIFIENLKGDPERVVIRLGDQKIFVKKDELIEAAEKI